jgi:hypothetical protein
MGYLICIGSALHRVPIYLIVLAVDFRVLCKQSTWPIFFICCGFTYTEDLNELAWTGQR